VKRSHTFYLYSGISGKSNELEEMEMEKAHEQREPTGCNFGGVVTFGVGLVAGTFSAVVCKMLYETSSEGSLANLSWCSY
jgi:hypothetical protein